MLPYAISELDSLREAEIDLLLQRHGAIFSEAALLEVGAGSGRQLAALSRTASLTVGVDVPTTTYHQPKQTGRVAYYNGVNLPFADHTFDVVYSSNTMEHVLNERDLHNELKRVLRPTGVAVHIVPSSTWRLWTMATYYLMLPTLIVGYVKNRTVQRDGSACNSTAPRASKSFAQLLLDLICPMRHGERGNRFTEWWHFRGAAWKRRFEEFGWKVESVEGLGIFNTGYLVASRFMSMGVRRRLACVLGSSCLVIILKPSTRNYLAGKKCVS
jgi:SAM-dependent methyltransferase